jgi:uncharacterized cofD-like protein
MKDKKKIVVIGGGTGTSTVLSGLKKWEAAELTAIVTVSDNGGNSGKLRDEFGFVPVGDMRQCLAALADGEHSERVRELLLYRFGGESQLAGYNLGNVLLTALEDIYQSPGKAVAVASEILRIKGRVLPISEQIVDLAVTYDDGTKIIGEDYLNYVENGGKKIREIALVPAATMDAKAAAAIKQAELIILGPGDLYASLLPNTLVTGFKKTLREAPGKFVYVVNLMNSFQQTHQMKTSDHVAEVNKYCGRKPDVVVVNNEKFETALLKEYAKHGETPMEDDLDERESARQGMRVIKTALVSKVKVEQNKNDQLHRGVLRHDSAKLTELIKKLLAKK